MKRLITFIIMIWLPSKVFSQSATFDQLLLKDTKMSDSTVRLYPPEKLFLQFDKPYYATGDTIWFKAWLFNSPTMLFSNKSGLLHVDITSDSGRLVKQYLFPISSGISWGNISLDEKNFKTGSYNLHAYTNWMRNFGTDLFYTKQFYVAGLNENNWLINAKISSSNTGDKQQANARLQFTDRNKNPAANKQLQLKLYAGPKNLNKQTLQTDENGSADINFTIPEKSISLALVAENEKEGQKAVIPIILNRPEKADVQFLPEGGSLVANLPANIGFKAIGEDGKGIDISGTITDHNGQQVANFQSLHNGMGSFRIPVTDGENYFAKVTLPGGLVKEYPLPTVKNSGTILQIKNQAEADSLEVTIAAGNDLAKQSGNYYLIAKARGITCYAAIADLKNGNYIRRKIAKRLFPSGITHFMLLDAKEQPLNERLIFIDHQDELQINISPGQPAYALNDSIALHITVTDNTGKPASGNFSMSVTDDAQINADSTNSILTNLLLTSDLIGSVEGCDYYAQNNAMAAKALDNLLLTQGWVNYDWQGDKAHPVYEAENEFTVKGRVSNVFDKPVRGSRVELLSKSPVLVKDTVTDKEGRFAFSNFPQINTPEFILKSVNKNGKSFNVGLKVDEPSLPVFKSVDRVTMPWYVNTDVQIINYTIKRDSINLQRDFNASGGHHLREVKITAKKIVKGSQNLNGPGNADLTLDEKDMEKAGKKTWLQLFEEKVKNFKWGSYGHYYVDNKPIIIIVDGIRYMMNDYGPDMTNFLQSHDAEDIKGIEVMYSQKYIANYFRRYVPIEVQLYLSFTHYAFIEITTRSGHGPFLKSTPGMYLYEPQPISYPKQFYKPKYTVADTAKHLPDLRSTIDWEPNVTTDKNGNATVSFYAADKPGTYTLITEGTDGNGNLGHKRQKIKIGKK